ncbi:MAG: M20/M25/M40 family metallo-hydrolase [Flavisolibacter sp.]
MRRIILFLMFLSCINGNAQSLTAEEKKIIANIRKHLSENLQLLEDLININSGTLNIAGVKKTGELLGKQFERIGFTTEWINLPDSLKRAGHLVASVKGRKGKKLLLIGHLDTVFEPDMPSNPYKKLNDSTATGQGANDMKGGDVIIFAALQALFETGALNDRTIVAYFTGDEERSGSPDSVSRRDFIERAKQSDIGLGFETAQGLGKVAIARRGASSWQLKVRGEQGHSAGVFNNKYGSIYEAARILNEFREQLGKERYLTFNPGLFSGGSDLQFDSLKATAFTSGKTNIISPATVVTGDLRFLTVQQKESARKKMRAIVSNDNLPGTSATISFKNGIPAMEPTKGNESLVYVLNKVSKDLGYGVVQAADPGSRGAGDISYVAKYIDCIDGLGASGSGAHEPGEIIKLNEFPLLIERAALLIYRLTR